MLQRYLGFLNGGGDAEGQGLVEYAFILVLVAVVVIVTVVVLGEEAANLYNTAETLLPFN